MVQTPLQQREPALHCESIVQPQVAALHWCVPVSQQVPPVQSWSLQQPAVQLPLQQVCPAPH